MRSTKYVLYRPSSCFTMKQNELKFTFGFLLVSSLTGAVPVELTGAQSANTSLATGCIWENVEYEAGEQVASPGPCEQCVCRPPNVQCTMIKCKTNSGCKMIQRANHCCPDFKCDCEYKGRVYNNGERLDRPDDPCQVCYCKGGEIMCTSITCYERLDCQPYYIPGQCCPKYDHCPLESQGNNKSANTSLFGSKREIQPWLMTKPITVKPIENIKVTTSKSDEIMPVNVYPQTLKIHEILPTTSKYEHSNGKRPVVAAVSKLETQREYAPSTESYYNFETTSQEEKTDFKEAKSEESQEVKMTASSGNSKRSNTFSITEITSFNRENSDQLITSAPTATFQISQDEEEALSTTDGYSRGSGALLLEDTTNILSLTPGLPSWTEGESKIESDIEPTETVKIRSVTGEEPDSYFPLTNDPFATYSQEIENDGTTEESFTVKEAPFVLSGGIYEPFNESTAEPVTGSGEVKTGDSDEPSVEQNSLERMEGSRAASIRRSDDWSSNYESSTKLETGHSDNHELSFSQDNSGDSSSMESNHFISVHKEDHIEYIPHLNYYTTTPETESTTAAFPMEIPEDSILNKLKDIEGDSALYLYVTGRNPKTNGTALYMVLSPLDLRRIIGAVMRQNPEKSSHFDRVEFNIGWLPNELANRSESNKKYETNSNNETNSSNSLNLEINNSVTGKVLRDHKRNMNYESSLLSSEVENGSGSGETEIVESSTNRRTGLINTESTVSSEGSSESLEVDMSTRRHKDKLFTRSYKVGLSTEGYHTEMTSDHETSTEGVGSFEMADISNGRSTETNSIPTGSAETDAYKESGEATGVYSFQSEVDTATTESVMYHPIRQTNPSLNLTHLSDGMKKKRNPPESKGSIENIPVDSVTVNKELPTLNKSDQTSEPYPEEDSTPSPSSSPDMETSRKIPDVEPFLRQLPSSLDQKDISILKQFLERHFSE